MLPEATNDVAKLKEEAEYFTNQVHREVRRVTAMNYELLRATTLNIAEMHLRLTSQVSTGWQYFQNYYCSQNEQRKEDDEKALIASADDYYVATEDNVNDSSIMQMPLYKEDEGEEQVQPIIKAK